MSHEALAGIIVVVSFLIVYLVEFAFGHLRASPRPLRDFAFTVVGALSQTTVSGALVGTAVGLLAAQLWPNGAGSLGHWSFWLVYPALFVTNEFMHYWLHRYAHEWRWLWKIHRTHHSAQYLNSGVLYRYNVFWVMLIPHTWTGALAVYFGLGAPFMAAVLTTFFVNLATHTSFRWDLYLREIIPSTEPAWRVIEKVLTLPDAHHAHHAYGPEAHPNGNYAISIFAFDVLFGTAKIPNARQTRYGLPISPRLPWAEELLWPVVRQPLLPKPEKRS